MLGCTGTVGAHNLALVVAYDWPHGTVQSKHFGSLIKSPYTTAGTKAALRSHVCLLVCLSALLTVTSLHYYTTIAISTAEATGQAMSS